MERKNIMWKNTAYNTVTGSSSQEYGDTGVSETGFKPSFSTMWSCDGGNLSKLQLPHLRNG